MSNQIEFKVGQLYRNADPAGNGWCKHGLVAIETEHKGALVCRDTYWGPLHSDSSYTRLPAEIAHYLTFVIDMNECVVATRNKYEIYADSDRAFIPGGGRSECYLVRKDAKPDPVRHAEWLTAKIADLEMDIRVANKRIGSYREELATVLQAGVANA